MACAEDEVGKGFLLAGSTRLTTQPAPDRFPDTGFSIEAWGHAFTCSGRVVAHSTAYLPDGYLLDTYGSKVLGNDGGQPVGGATPLTPGAWVHLATTFDPLTGTLSVHLNGVLDGAVSVAGAGFSSTKPLRLGADSSGSSLMSGVRDEDTLFDRPLRNAESLAIANASGAGKCKP
jgi:hypothetical protein